jgi:hypothetical protein
MEKKPWDRQKAPGSHLLHSEGAIGLFGKEREKDLE